MLDTLSTTYGDEIPGTDENDTITIAGARSKVFGNGGDDILDARRYLSTVRGGAGNDTLYAGRSYINLFGDEGDDYLFVDTGIWGENIANVTLEGGAGADTFKLMNGSTKKVSSAYITDFGTGKDSLMLADNRADTLYISHTTNDEGNLVVRVRYDETQLTFEGISELDKLENVIIGNSDLSTITVIPPGLELSSDTLKVHSEYEGALWLGGTDVINNETVWGDAAITTIDASDDTFGGRMLGGNDADNYIRANNYGSLMWGGDDGDDTLVGGDGADMFLVGRVEDDENNVGNTDVIDCGEDDLVILMDINLSDLATVELTTSDASIHIDKEDRSYIEIAKSAGARTTTVQLADNSKWQYTYSDRSWQFKP